MNQIEDCLITTFYQRFMLKFGDRDLNNNNDDLARFTREIKKTIRHPRYNAGERTAYYDVAIWEVEPFDFNAFVRPVCLPKSPRNFVDRYSGDFVTVTGWGLFGKNEEKKDDILRQIGIRVFSSRYCNRTHANAVDESAIRSVKIFIPRYFQSDLICAGYEQGGGVCHGDSGSPMVQFDTDGDNALNDHYVQLGIVSGGVGKCGDKRYPAIFIRLEDHSVLTFIKRTIATSSPVIKATPSPSTTPPPLTGTTQPLLSEEYVLNILTNLTGVFVASGANINNLHLDTGVSFLSNSIDINNFQLAKHWLDSGTDPNIRDKNTGKTALHHACELSYDHFIRLLLNYDNINVNALDNTRRSPLNVCAAAGTKDGVNLLLARGAIVDNIDQYSCYPLLEAANCGCRREVILPLLEAGSNPNLALTCDNCCYEHRQGRTALHVAAMSSTDDVVKALIEHGADVNLVDIYGSKPFTLASGWGKTENVDYMIGAGHADYFTRSNDGYTPLMLAAFYGHTGVVTSLLRNGPRQQIDLTSTTDGFTPLHYAATNGKDDIVQILLQNGANKELLNHAGKTAEQLARDKGYFQIADRIRFSN